MPLTPPSQTDLLNALPEPLRTLSAIFSALAAHLEHLQETPNPTYRNTEELDETPINNDDIPF